MNRSVLKNRVCATSEGKGVHLQEVWGPNATSLLRPGPGLGLSPQGEPGMLPQLKRK